jgi:hypothetical protein
LIGGNRKGYGQGTIATTNKGDVQAGRTHLCRVHRDPPFDLVQGRLRRKPRRDGAAALVAARMWASPKLAFHRSPENRGESRLPPVGLVRWRPRVDHLLTIIDKFWRIPLCFLRIQESIRLVSNLHDEEVTAGSYADEVRLWA